MGDVAVKIGAREHHTQAALAVPCVPSLNRIGRATGMQGQHHIVVFGLRIGPLPHDAGKMPRQQVLPATRGLPVAVVGVGQSGADNDDTKFLHGRFIHE